jgi:hypothetical protein
LGLGPNIVEGLEAAENTDAGGGPAGLGRLFGTNLLPLFRNPSLGDGGPGRNGRGPGLPNGLEPNGLPGTELGPLDKVADENPEGITEATSFCTGGEGGGLAVVKAGTNGATVVLTKSTTALAKEAAVFPKALKGRRGCSFGVNEGLNPNSRFDGVNLPVFGENFLGNLGSSETTGGLNPNWSFPGLNLLRSCSVGYSRGLAGTG